MTAHRLITIALLLGLATAAYAQDLSPLDAWSGSWRGTLVNMPEAPSAPHVVVTMTFGPATPTNGRCIPWHTTHTEGGVTKQVKDYKICRGESAGAWYIDEGPGTHLTGRWLGTAFVSSFKADTFLVVATMRLTGDVLTEEIVTVDDKPAISGIQPLVPRSIQRIEMRRTNEQ